MTIMILSRLLTRSSFSKRAKYPMPYRVNWLVVFIPKRSKTILQGTWRVSAAEKVALRSPLPFDDLSDGLQYTHQIRTPAGLSLLTHRQIAERIDCRSTRCNEFSAFHEQDIGDDKSRGRQTDTRRIRIL